MKKPAIIPSIVLALALPAVGLAQDQTDPGKSGDASKNPPSAAPGRPAEPLRTPDEGAREPGKSSDAVRTPNSASLQEQFSGAITAVNRNEKTITIDDAAKVPHKLQIGDTTRIKRGDKDASWDDLKVGLRVNGICSGNEGAAHAETVNISG